MPFGHHLFGQQLFGSSSNLIEEEEEVIATYTLIPDAFVEIAGTPIDSDEIIFPHHPIRPLHDSVTSYFSPGHQAPALEGLFW